jgi:hypothetical protein
MSDVTATHAAKEKQQAKPPALRSPGPGYQTGHSGLTSSILALQAAAGNRAVSDLVQMHTANSRPPMIQAKLTINQPGDKYEQQADRIADKVMRTPKPEANEKRADLSQPQLQQPMLPTNESEVRHKPIEDEEKILQAKAAPGQTPTVSPSIESRVKGIQSRTGEPLPPEICTSMEARFGHDLSQVRIHRDTEASDLANRLNSRAFTIGKNIIFRSGEYQPGTSLSNQLLAHELTHVMQQSLNSYNLLGRRKLIQRTPAKEPEPEENDEGNAYEVHWKGSVKESLIVFLTRRLRVDQKIADRMASHIMSHPRFLIKGEDVSQEEFEKRSESFAVPKDVVASAWAAVSLPLDELKRIEESDKELPEFTKKEIEAQRGTPPIDIPDRPLVSEPPEQKDESTAGTPLGLTPSADDEKRESRECPEPCAFLTLPGVGGSSRTVTSSVIEFAGERRVELRQKVKEEARHALWVEFRDYLARAQIAVLTEVVRFKITLPSQRRLRPGDKITIRVDVGKVETLLLEMGLLEGPVEQENLPTLFRAESAEAQVLAETLSEGGGLVFGGVGSSRKVLREAKQKVRQAKRETRRKARRGGRATKKEALAAALKDFSPKEALDSGLKKRSDGYTVVGSDLLAHGNVIGIDKVQKHFRSNKSEINAAAEGVLRKIIGNLYGPRGKVGRGVQLRENGRIFIQLPGGRTGLGALFEPNGTFRSFTGKGMRPSVRS